VLNRVYRLLTSGMDVEQREKFDADLYAPAEGWARAEMRLWSVLDGAAGGD
jgi:hypothetical protein